MPVEFVVTLNDDGTVTWCGLSVDQDEHAEAVENIQAAIPGSSVIDAPLPESPSVTEQLSEFIKNASTHEGLAQLWRDNRDLWTAEHNRLAAQRKKELGKEN